MRKGGRRGERWGNFAGGKITNMETNEVFGFIGMYKGMLTGEDVRIIPSWSFAAKLCATTA